MTPFQKLCIIGLGHIGSSIAHAAKRGDLALEIAGYDKSGDVRTRAAKIGFCTRVYDDLATAVDGADLVLLCTPVGSYKSVAADVAPHLAAGAILSDVGSVKKAAIRDIAPFVPPGVAFVPAHPLAGTEYSGPESGSPACSTSAGRS